MHSLSSLFTTDTLAGRALWVALLLGAASAVWWLVRRRAERFTPTTPAPAGGGAEPALTAAELGADLGRAGTFVQFSAQTCATCPQVHRLLTSIAATEPGVAHVELAAEERMDLVRRFAVFRTPTVLLLDGRGVVRARMSGALTRAHAVAALRDLAPQGPGHATITATTAAAAATATPASLRSIDV
ncbi:TlpA family protein disulfide reductase [Pengzhenrongella sicca]|uniref:Thioredoxin family protein n=1 Tax=Pengzhenrongella sicca TaxID=2819238 RepID=A0A8A4ZFU9_9MICO|nr:thioredoxin family protein [Pengzhenrongella sicca]QTE30890.1 thioredoxin family protein [Pengzhenrongella sicca]